MNYELRVVAHNVLFTFVGLTLIAIAGEIYLRLTRSTSPPPRAPSYSLPLHFVQGVGLMLKPNAEVRYSFNIDHLTLSHTNSLGFLDREPISTERAAESCHIAMIGDSFIEAREVPIADKFHIRLEELAARHLPHLDITTSAYGFRATGQVNQLPLYDAFARHLSPKLVVLVFVDNDFSDNSPILNAIKKRIHLDRQPFVTAARDENGALKLRPPYPDWQRSIAHLLPISRDVRIGEHLRWSYFSYELYDRIYSFSISLRRQLGRYPAHESMLELDEEQLKILANIDDVYHKKTLSPFFEKELAFTAFGLDQFVERTERDGTSLVILATYTMRTRGHPIFDRLNAMAEARGIPVIDQYDYIRRQGADPETDPRYAHDFHWNEQGHQWAAEALLEYLKENPEVCTRPPSQETP